MTTPTIAAEVASILDEYANGGDYEAAHGDEDALLERYVRMRAKQGDKAARSILRLLDADRVRWYA